MIRFAAAGTLAIFALAAPALAQVQPSAPVASKSYVDAETARAQAAEALLTPQGRQIGAAGLATGGGSLSADRTITVPKATQSDVATGTDDAKALTALSIAPALAAKAPLASPTFTGSSSFASSASQYPVAASVLPSTHATSRRAAIGLDTWLLMQDTAASGVKDFGIFSSGIPGFVLSFNTSGVATFAQSPTAPTPSANDNTTKLATTAFTASAVAVETSRAQAAEALRAPLASPAFTGAPTVPTASAGTNTTQAASTAFTASAVAAEASRATAAEALLAPLASPSFTGAVSVGGTIAVGGGEAIKAVRRLTVTVGFGTIPANSTVQFNNISLPGVKTGDLLTVSLGNAWSSVAIPMYAISYADNQISLFAANPTSTAQAVNNQPVVVRAERY